MILPDQYVLMQNDKRRLINRILFDDQVVTHLGRLRPVLNRWSMPHEGTVHAVYWEKGHVICTADHPLRLSVGGVDEWRPAKDIAVGDIILGAGGQYVTVTLHFTHFYRGLMYNLSVADDNSFTVNGVCVHNGG